MTDGWLRPATLSFESVSFVYFILENSKELTSAEPHIDGIVRLISPVDVDFKTLIR